MAVDEINNSHLHMLTSCQTLSLSFSLSLHSIALPEKLEHFANKYAEHSHEKWSAEKVPPGRCPAGGVRVLMWLYLYKYFILSLHKVKKKAKVMVTVAVFSLQYESSSFFTVSRHAKQKCSSDWAPGSALSFVSTSLLCLKKKKAKITAKITFTNRDVAPILA